MIINKECETPMYLQLKDYIIDEIGNGQLPPGSKVPSETEISEQFNISRVTVRKAYGELGDEGYLVRKRGKGTFVRDVRVYMDLSCSKSFTLTCKSLGLEPSTVVLNTGFVEADKRVASALSIEPGTKVAYAERVRYADNVAVRIEYNYYFPAYVSIIEEDLSKSISRILEEKFGIHGTRESHYRITIDYTDQRESNILNTKNMTPILAVTGTMFNIKNEPIYYTDMRHLPDRCMLIV
ncbi:MAG: GntR family transcriptional regulator [Clostridia bacterium]|nr:GntR family transcriptional regulator [Clostridia bacterium]